MAEEKKGRGRPKKSESEKKAKPKSGLGRGRPKSATPKPKSELGRGRPGKELVQPKPIKFDSPEEVAAQLAKFEKDIEKRKTKALTEMTLAVQESLDEIQLRAANLMGEGKTDSEIVSQLNIRPASLAAWKMKPNFMAKVNEVTMKFGHADKTNRIRANAWILDKVWETIYEKEEELKDMSVTALLKIAQEHGKIISEETTDNSKKNAGDISVLMVNYFKESKGFAKVDTASDILHAPELDYLDAEYEEISEEEFLDGQ